MFSHHCSYNLKSTSKQFQDWWLGSEYRWQIDLWGGDFSPININAGKNQGCMARICCGGKPATHLQIINMCYLCGYSEANGVGREWCNCNIWVQTGISVFINAARKVNLLQYHELVMMWIPNLQNHTSKPNHCLYWIAQSRQPEVALSNLCNTYLGAGQNNIFGIRVTQSDRSCIAGPWILG